MSPQRIQRKRTKGWRMPEGAVYVGRGSQWGNPWKVEQLGKDKLFYVHDGTHDVSGGQVFNHFGSYDAKPEALAAAATMYRNHLTGWYISGHPREDGQAIASAAYELAGKNLACWCPLDQPCHADVLLELANEGEAA
jgi:hypothetical protein